jgi:hypothetical protein
MLLIGLQVNNTFGFSCGMAAQQQRAQRQGFESHVVLYPLLIIGLLLAAATGK